MKLTDVRLYFEELKQTKGFIWTARIVLVSLFLSLVFVLVLWSKLPRQVPLYYSLPWGEEQLAHPLALIILLLTSGSVYCLNAFLGILVKQKWPFFMYILLLGGTMVTLLTIFTVVRIVLLMI